MAQGKTIVRALVYRYTFWDEATHEHRTSTVYATLPAIHNGLGLPIYDSVMYVDPEDLQGGIYLPDHVDKEAP